MFWPIRIGSIILALAFAFGLSAIAGGAFDSFTQRLIVLASLYVTLSVSLNLINGITGQFSIGHAAFYQVGAYTTLVVGTALKAPAGLPPGAWLVVVMIAGAIGAGIAGFVVGLPSLRLKGDYLAIVTLGFGEIVRIFVTNQPWLGGAYGKNILPDRSELVKNAVMPFAILLAITTIAVSRNLLKTAHGLPFLAVREDEVAAKAMGVNVTLTKVAAFVLGSAFAGAAGALFAQYETFIGPNYFTMDQSFIIVTMVVLGGTGSITGSAIAAMLLFYLPEKMRDIGDVPMGGVVAATILLVAVVATIRHIGANVHAPKRKAQLIVGTIISGVVLTMIIGPILGHIPALSGTVEGVKLRMAVFAITLVVLMLLRPSGIFGHHEFSWSWVKRLRQGSGPRTEIAA